MYTTSVTLIKYDLFSCFQMLLIQNTHWEIPKLLELPRNYDAIFQTYRQKHCRNCTSIPHDPALCLICSQLLCFKETCCKKENVFECVQVSDCLFNNLRQHEIIVVRINVILWQICPLNSKYFLLDVYYQSHRVSHVHRVFIECQVPLDEHSTLGGIGNIISYLMMAE